MALFYRKLCSLSSIHLIIVFNTMCCLPLIHVFLYTGISTVCRLGCTDITILATSLEWFQNPLLISDLHDPALLELKNEEYHMWLSHHEYMCPTFTAPFRIIYFIVNTPPIDVTQNFIMLYFMEQPSDFGRERSIWRINIEHCGTDHLIRTSFAE